MYQRIKNIEVVRELIRAEVSWSDLLKSYGVDIRTMGGGKQLKACCPFHQEDTPSFGVDTEKGLSYCFGCKQGGDVFKFVQTMDNCEHMEAVRKLADFVRFDLGPYKEAYTEADRARQELFNINVDVLELGRTNATDSRFTSWIGTRRLDASVLDAYGVGYSGSPLGPSAVPTADKTQAENLGLDRDGAWNGVVVVPVRDPYGRVAGFRNRLLDPSANIKVIGPRETHPLPVPSIYGLYEARQHIRRTGYLILVEGEVDVWQMVSHGYKNVAAMIGSKLNEEMAQLLDSLSITKVVVLADNDEPGRKFSRKLAETRFSTKLLVKIGTLTGNGKDPDEILLSDGADAIGATLGDATYAFEYLIDRVCEGFDVKRQTDKLDILNELKPHLANAPDLERELAVRSTASRLGLDYEVVLDFFREGDAATPMALQNIHAERVVLKRMLADEDFVGECLVALKSSDFYLSKHRLVFDGISQLYRKQEVINEATVRTWVENKGGEGAVGLFTSILHDSVDTAAAEYLLGDLKDKSIRRDVQARARDAANRLGDTKQDAKAVVQALSSGLAASIVGGGQSLITMGQLVQERIGTMHQMMKNPNAIIGYDIGHEFPTLNGTLHGLQTKRYCVVSAPSGTGKTALMCAWIKRFGVDLKIPTLAFTFETGTEALTDRIISNISGVESDKILTGYISGAEAELVQRAAAEIAASPVVLTERGLDADECAALIRHDVLRRGTKIVFVDYIQLMVLMSAGNVRRDQELGMISRSFLEMCKELDILLVVLAQQNRESVKAGSNEGTGIGESFKIFQDSDIFITFREKTKDEMAADGPDKGNRKMKLPKNRHGRGGIEFNMQADLAVMRLWECVSGQRKPVSN